MLLLALGVATVTLTLLLTRELEDRLARDAAGIDLVVGAKGSPLQLVLAGVYHVDVPPGNIPATAIARLRANPLIAAVIPLALGDSVRGFRIVGTEPALVTHYGGTLHSGTLWHATAGGGARQRSGRGDRARGGRDIRGFARPGGGRRCARGRAVSRDRHPRADRHRGRPARPDGGRERVGGARSDASRARAGRGGRGGNATPTGTTNAK